MVCCHNNNRIREDFCPLCIVPVVAAAGGASAAGGSASKKKMWIWIGISLILSALMIWIYLKFIKKGCKTCPRRKA